MKFEKGGTALVEDPSQQEQGPSEDYDNLFGEGEDPLADFDFEADHARKVEEAKMASSDEDESLVSGRLLEEMRKIRIRRGGEFKKAEMESTDILTENARAKKLLWASY